MSSAPGDDDRLDLEQLLVHPDGFGLEEASSLQRAICRVIDGQPVEMTPELRAALGTDTLPPGMPDEVLLLAAIRCAKSLISAAVAFQKTQTVDVSGIGPGHYPRIPILATDKDAARATFDHLIGRTGASKLLKSRIIGEPTADTVWFQHPSGMPIEVKVTANARLASTLISRWFGAVIFDEAPRMSGQDDSVINLEHAQNAIGGRILPGGQVLYIGSPSAPFGPVYNMVSEHWGKPTAELVVLRATGPAMRPALYTPEYCEKIRRKRPQAYRENVLAEFSDPESAMFALDDVEKATRKEPEKLAPVETQFYTAAMDPATRANAWTLVVVTTPGLGGPLGAAPMYQVVHATQWVAQKGSPLAPDNVFREMAAVLAPYGITRVETDQFAFDILRSVAERHGLELNSTTMTAQLVLENAERIKALLQEGRLELPPVPALKSDLLRAKKRATQAGVRLVLPETSDGRHGDYVPSLGLALATPPDLPMEPEAPKNRFQRMLEADANQGDRWEAIGNRLVGRV